METEGRVIRQVGGRGYYAAVGVVRTPDATGLRVVIDHQADDEWQRAQGWTAAAAAGAALGLELAGAAVGLAVTRVHGMVCDTSPGLVAIAAVRAAWGAVGFAPDRSLADAVEGCIGRGHRLSPEALRTELLARRPAESAAPDHGGIS